MHYEGWPGYRTIARMALTVALVAAPLGLGGSASAQTRDDLLNNRPGGLLDGRPSDILGGDRRSALGTPVQRTDGRALLRVEPDACRTLVNHVPTTDVAYQPGVTVYGRPVAPADLPGSPGANPSLGSDLPIQFRINIDLAQRLGLTPDEVNRRFGIPSGQGASIQDLTAANVSIVGDQVMINGRPIGQDAERELALLCREAGRF